MSDKMIGILIMGLSGLILGIIAALLAKSRKNYKPSLAMPKWGAAGICIGIIIGVATKNIGAAGGAAGITIGIGVIIGILVGHHDQKHERTIQSNK